MWPIICQKKSHPKIQDILKGANGSSPSKCTFWVFLAKKNKVPLLVHGGPEKNSSRPAKKIKKVELRRFVPGWRGTQRIP